MGATWTIFKREVSAYFNSPVAYTVAALFLAITGAMFWLNFFQDLTPVSLRGFFTQSPLFLTFFAPAITMGLFAQERRSGTLELLMTLPVRDVHIVLGKFFAAVFLLAVVFLATLPYPLTLDMMAAKYQTSLDWGATIAGYIGLLLLGSTYAAIGLMASSWTRDQEIAILIAFVLCFVLYILDQLVGQPVGTTAQIVEHLSTAYHFRNIARGVLDLRDVVYYLSVITACLTATTATLSARRA